MQNVIFHVKLWSRTLRNVLLPHHWFRCYYLAKPWVGSETPTSYDPVSREPDSKSWIPKCQGRCFCGTKNGCGMRHYLCFRGNGACDSCEGGGGGGGGGWAVGM